MRCIFNFWLIIWLVAISADVQAQEAWKLKIEAPATFDMKGNNEGALRCSINRALLQKANKQGVQFYLYAMNDVRKLPMLLTEKGKNLPVNMRSMAANSPYLLIFTAPLAKLLFTSQGNNKYTWTWRGRAKAPVSPIADAAGSKVKQVKCWFQANVDKKVYTSDTITIAINQ